MKAFAATLIALGLALAGCGDAADPPTVPEPTGDDVLITYTRSGGFAPVLERLTIEADGDGLARSGFGASARKARAFKLGVDELEKLRAAIGAASLDELETGEYACADCYGYRIETAAGDATFSDVDFEAGSGANIPPEVQALYGLLGDLAARYMPQEPTIGG